MKTITREQIETELKDCLRFVAGEHCPVEWHPDDDVLCSCDIDSMHGVELACDLVARLGINIPQEDNPLIEDDRTTGRKRHRTFREVVEYLQRMATH